MLKKFMGIAASAIAAGNAATADDRNFEFLSAVIDGRLTVAIVDQQGTAVALSVEENRVEIIRGLAAGAIVSDLQFAVTDYDTGLVPAGTRVERASAGQAAAMIDGLPDLTVAQRQQLRAILSL